MNSHDIISRLPYTKPFLFVDEIVSITENEVIGNYTFNENLDFYKGHFKGNPVTPGVILTEVMAQIGVVCLGIYLTDAINNETMQIALTSSTIEFLKPVYPNEKVIVFSKKIYFRFGKLKCTIVMKNGKDEEVCTGEIAGMIINTKIY